MSYELVALIRDIAIIVMAVMVTVAAVAVTVVLLKLYRPARRGIGRFEQASGLLLDAAAQVASVVSMGSAVAALVWNLLDRIGLGRGPKDDAAEDELEGEPRR